MSDWSHTCPRCGDDCFCDSTACRHHCSTARLSPGPDLSDLHRENKALREQLQKAERERDEARGLAEEACRRYNDSLRVVTCAFCGQAYPPETPTTGAAILAEHVAVCEKHPMRLVEQALAETKADLEACLVVLRALPSACLRDAQRGTAWDDSAWQRIRPLREARNG